MKKGFLTGLAMHSVLGLAFSILVLSSCSTTNSKNNGGYVMRFKANGNTVEFTVQASLTAAFGQSSNQYNGLFTGYDANSDISLQVFDDKTISESTYTGYTIVGSAVIGTLISYQDDTGTVYTQGSGSSDATVSITQITSKTVRGTFSGTLKASGKPDMAITGGQFYVWRAN